MITLGIDIGTTHTKVLALDIDRGQVLARESAATPVQGEPPGEQRDAGEVLDVVIDLAGRVTAKLADPGAVVALCAASVGEEVVLIDADGWPTGATIAWYDTRGSEEAKAFADGPGGGMRLTQRWPPDPSFSLFKLMWLRDQRPHEYRAASAWTDLGDFVLHRLGGELVMDWTHASRAGAFDIVERAWDPDTIDAAELTVRFPRLVPSGTVIGALDATVARKLGLSGRIDLVAGGHDHLCAAYGAGVRTSAELFLSAGTSEAHLALLDAPPVGGQETGDVDFGCYVDQRTWYAHVNIHSGHFFRQWRELLYAGIDDARMFAELGRASADELRFELAEDLRRGRLAGVPYDAGRAEVMRAVLDGLARRSAAIVDRLERVSGSPYELVLAAGHPTRTPLWRALRAAAYARPMAYLEEPEPTAFGAAVLAARSVAGAAADHLVADRHLGPTTDPS